MNTTRPPTGAHEQVTTLLRAHSLQDLMGMLREECKHANIPHLSFWGVDKPRNTIFYVTDMAEPALIQQEMIRVLPIDKSFLGECVSSGSTIIAQSDTELYNTTFVAKDFLAKHQLDMIMGIPLVERHDIQCVFLLAGQSGAKVPTEAWEPFKLLLECFVAQYAAIRGASYRSLLFNLTQASLMSDPVSFFATVSKQVDDYFHADAFSIWRAESDEKIHHRFSSKSAPDPAKTYERGESATGSCWSRKEIFFVHRMKDLERDYSVAWKSKHPELGMSANNEDHAIFVPILRTAVPSGETECCGVLRIVSQSIHNSFWPEDLEAARTIAKIISLRFSHDNAVESMRNERDRLKVLLELSRHVSKAREELSFSLKSFESLVESFNLQEIAFVRQTNPLADPEVVFDSVTGRDRNLEILDKFRRFKKIAPENRMTISRDRKEVSILLGSWNGAGPSTNHGILLLQFRDGESPAELSSSLSLFAAVLQIAWENHDFFVERGNLLRKWARAESSNRAGILARELAHEVKNRAKEIYNWMRNIQAGNTNPDYEKLRANCQFLTDISTDLLNKSMARYIRAEANLNEIVRESIRRYGVNNRIPEIEGHRLEFEFDSKLGPRGLPNAIVMIDSEAMISIIANIINNAVEQYQAQQLRGPILIKTEFKSIEGAQKAVLTIKDYAGGVSSTMKKVGASGRPKMFESFETEKEEGSGVGLFSAFEVITKRMDGTIAEIGTGKSAEFVITLPVKSTQPTNTNDN